VLEAGYRQVRAGGELNAVCRALNGLAAIEALSGRLGHAAAHYQAVLDRLRAAVTLERAQAQLGLAELALERNHLQAATEYLEHARWSAERSEQQANRPQLLLTLGRLQCALGRHEQALASLEAAEAAAQAWGNRSWTATAAAHQARFWLAEGDLARASRWAETLESDSGELAAYAWEPLALTLASVWIAEGQHARAQVLLADLAAEAAAAGRLSSAIEIAVVRTRAAAGEDHRAALEFLAQAVEWAEPGGYVRIFLDQGVPMLSLLREVRNQRIRSAYVGQLIRAFTGPSSAPAGGLLTEREREVLRLMALGCSNRDVAEHLVIAPQTAKVHVGRILHKLGARSRTQALLRAANSAWSRTYPRISPSGDARAVDRADTRCMSEHHPSQPTGARYQIRVRGQLDPAWTEWLDDLQVTWDSDRTSSLTGRVRDQAALQGLLDRLQDLGLPLLAVRCLDSHDGERSGS
jgi:LuxR family maltose regulon positive regulatory protein